MSKETSVNTKDAFAKLASQGATKTEVVLIQHDDSNPHDASLVARGTTATGQVLQDIELCPSPCNISQAFKPNT